MSLLDLFAELKLLFSSSKKDPVSFIAIACAKTAGYLGWDGTLGLSSFWIRLKLISSYPIYSSFLSYSANIAFLNMSSL